MISSLQRWKQPVARLSDSIPPGELFGIVDAATLARDYRTLAKDSLRGRRFQLGLSSAGHLRPDLSLGAYRGLVPSDGLAPIMNLFDRTGGGKGYSQRVTRARQRDFRGGRLSYDEHDGTDFVCPPGSPLLSAAPGTVVMIRREWLRGGLTIAVDHGRNVITHYTHCARSLVVLGQRVQRGTQIAWSGAAGADLFNFFPWVPPHVHFMVWADGVPVDPFVRPSEEHRNATWTRRNTPLPADTAFDASEPIPDPSGVDWAALDRMRATCASAELIAELDAACEAGPACAGATAEELLHHHAWAWAGRVRGLAVRPAAAEGTPPVRVAMPLASIDYRGARFADTRWSAPRGDVMLR
jgi:murein DD-endopeptidase MepM/ murein hydrolase activator NlpD